MSKWRDNITNLLTLAISAALVISGYLIGLIVTKTFLIAALLVLTVSLLAAGISAWTGHSSQARMSANFTRSTEHAASTIASTLTDSIQSLQASVNINLKSVERAVFDYLATFNPARGSIPSGTSQIAVLTKQQAAAIEATAEEIWIYAVNMTWDVDQGLLGKVVEDNLREAAKYRFLIPDRPEVKNRVRVLYTRWKSIPDIDTKVAFRVRREELLFAKFAISIYNPTYEKPSSDRRDLQTCVILFPNFGRPAPDNLDPFIKLNGPVVSDYEVEFSQIWQAAEKYLPVPLETL